MTSDTPEFSHVAADVDLGEGVQIHRFVNLYGCVVGAGTRIGAFVEIQRGARVGRNCKVSSHSFICAGVTIEDECFIGHHVVFVNDRDPAAVDAAGAPIGTGGWTPIETYVRRRASIGSGAVILAGVTVGEGAGAHRRFRQGSRPSWIASAFMSMHISCQASNSARRKPARPSSTPPMTR